MSGGRLQSRRLRWAHNEGTVRLHRTFFKLWNAPIMEEHGAVRCEKLRQMNTTAESNHTSYSVSAGHPPVSCVCFSTSFCNRRQGQQLKQLHVRWALGTTLVLHDRREFLLVALYWSWLLRQGSPRARISIFPSALLQAVIYTVKSHLVSLCWISTLRLFSFGVCACQGKRFVTIPLLGQAAIVLLISHPLLLVGNYPRSRVSPASSSLRYPD